MSEIIHGDCLNEMHDLEENSVDSVVTDPPYNFKGGFMGKKWDDLGEPEQYQKWCQEWAEECLRVLKPGGYLLAFSGTHSFHRLAVGVEDAGFEIKDTVMWLYGSGFPKSTDISKQIDKKFLREKLTEKLGHKPTRTQFKQAWEQERKKIGGYRHPDGNPRKWEEHSGKISGHSYAGMENKYSKEGRPITAPATPEASEWEGWGTALKPAHEPIVLAQKPDGWSLSRSPPRRKSLVQPAPCPGLPLCYYSE